MVVVDRQQIVPDLWELKINHRKVFVPETPHSLIISADGGI